MRGAAVKPRRSSRHGSRPALGLPQIMARSRADPAAPGRGRRPCAAVGRSVRRPRWSRPCHSRPRAHRRVVQQLARDLLAQQLMPRQLVDDVVAVGEVADAAHAVRDDHVLEALVGLRILDHRHPRRQPRAGAQQVEVAAGMQVADQEGAGRLAADQHFVAELYGCSAISAGPSALDAKTPVLLHSRSVEYRATRLALPAGRSSLTAVSTRKRRRGVVH